MVSIGPTIGIKGETAYNTALKRIIAETKNLDSQMNLLTSSFTKNDNAIERNRKKQELLTKQIESAEKVLSKMREGVDLATQKQEAAAKKLEQAQKAHENAVRVYGQESEEAKKTATAVQKAQTAYDAASTSVEKMTADMNNQMAEINNLRNALKDLPNNLQIIGDSMQEIGGKFVDVGQKLTTYVTAPLAAAGGTFVKWASDFTDGMAKIYTIADQSEVPMEQMRQQLIELSNTSGFSLEDLAEAEYQAVSASVATADSIAFLTQATKLARAGFTSTTKSVDILSTIMNSYGKEVYDVEYISDVLLKTQNDGKIVVDQMAQGMGVIVPLASAYHVGLEDVAAALATMTKQGVPASKSITFIRALFTELEKEGSTVNKTLDTMTGKTFAQLMDEGYNLSEVLQMLYNSVDRDSESFERLFGNVRSSQAVASLLNDDFRTLDRELANMYGSAGQTSRALETLETPSLKAKRAIQQLKNSGMELGQTLINEMYPYFLKVIEGIKNFTTWFSQLDSKTKETIVNMGLFAAAVGPVIIGIGKLTQAIGSIVSGAGAVMRVFDGYDNAILKLATGAEKISPAFGEVALSLGTALPWVLALGAAFTGVAISVEGAMEAERAEILAQWGMTDAIRENITVSEEAAVAYASRKLAIQEEQAATAGQVETAKMLVEEYNNLVDANGEIAEGDREMATLIQTELAEALGMELSDVQALVEENGLYGASIDETMNKILQRAELRAYEDLYTEAIKRKVQAEADYKTQSEALEEQHRKTEEAQRLVEQATKDLEAAQARGGSEVHEYELALDNAVNALGAAQSEEEKLQDAVNTTKQNVDSAVQDANTASNNIRRITGQTMNDTTNAIKSGGDKVVTEAGNLSDRAENALSIDGYSPGYNAGAGLANGIDDASWRVESAAARIASIASRAMRNALLEKSPSRVTAEIGKYFSEGFAIGIEDEAYKAISAANMLAESAIGGMSMVDPPVTNNTRNITAPITITLNVNGNVDGDDRQFTRNIAEDLVNLMNRESEVFA